MVKRKERTQGGWFDGKKNKKKISLIYKVSISKGGRGGTEKTLSGKGATERRIPEWDDE